MKFNRIFAMPNADTFSVKPIGEFVQRYLAAAKVSVDPFARDREWFTHTNDLNPETKAQSHMDAEDFCKKIHADGVIADLGVFDPPYSPRQISEVYKSVGRTPTMQDTQSSFWRKNRDALDALIAPSGVVLSFGWNSMGMGLKRNYEILEILLCAHGGAHNDTICVAERKIPILI